MSRIESTILIEAPVEDVFAFHADPVNLSRVLPPYMRMDVFDAPNRLSQDTVLRCAIFVGPLRFDWENQIIEYVPPHRFVDVQRKGPFGRYVHTHSFSPEAASTRLTDTIDFDLPLGPLAELAVRVGFGSRMREVLEYGQRATKALLERKGAD